MTIRSRREVVTFKHPFRIRGIERLLPEGAYEVVTDEETIEGLSFAVYRRVATMIVVPVEGSRGAAVEMVSIGSVDLADAQRIDARASDDWRPARSRQASRHGRAESRRPPACAGGSRRSCEGAARARGRSRTASALDYS